LNTTTSVRSDLKTANSDVAKDLKNLQKVMLTGFEEADSSLKSAQEQLRLQVAQSDGMAASIKAHSAALSALNKQFEASQAELQKKAGAMASELEVELTHTLERYDAAAKKRGDDMTRALTAKSKEIEAAVLGMLGVRATLR